MASKTHGLQQLLTAEKRATEKITDARKRKVLRLKQAKEEAQLEIAKYREQRENAFKDFESTFMGSRSDGEARVEQQTIQNLEAMKVQVEENKEEVISRVLEVVCDIKPELHRNFRGPDVQDQFYFG
ncbi:unnamed protein product [Orchesella dallaii]|uniref:V-type proton ATPase subunit G n=1 Tax=Orchesella dallaii TaxID=48710 RepID=A0ABP1PX84_9HEXA